MQNDETLSSSWVIHELETARHNSIPIIVVVDADQQTPRQIISITTGKGFGWLFDEQVVAYSMQSRERSYELIISAIKRAVAHCNESKNAVARSGIHGKPTGMSEGADLEGQFRSLVLSRYASVQEAWNAFEITGKGALSRSDFKRVISKTLGLRCTDAERRALRSKLDPLQTKQVSYDALLEFVDGTQHKDAPAKKLQQKEEHKLAVLPMGVPSLPDNFRPRTNVEQQLKGKLLDHNSKPCITAQGMGGVGKSVITAAVLRSEEIRARFVNGIAWIGLSQKPEVLALQQSCYFQLTAEHMPKESQHSEEEQHSCLSKALASKTVLVCIDDCWDKQHAKCFDVIDTATRSKLLVSTRYSHCTIVRCINVYVV